MLIKWYFDVEVSQKEWLSANPFMLVPCDTGSGKVEARQRYRTGPMQDPCGTPVVRSLVFDNVLPTLIVIVLSDKEDSIHCRASVEIPKTFSSYHRVKSS